MSARPSAARALALLVGDHVRRLLREGIVLRSLVFPGALVSATVGLTITLLSLWQAPQQAALSPDAADEALVAALRSEGFGVRIVEDPRAAVRDGKAAAGTDGTTLFIGPHQVRPALEARLRRSLGAAWEPWEPTKARTQAILESDAARPPAVFVAVLFALYGVVFGAGGVARDKDEGTLDAELSTGVPHVVHGFARWLAGSLVLGVFYAVTVGLLHALMGLPEPLACALHGAAASAAATSIGLLVVGRAGLGRGFVGPMSTGLVAVFALVSLGLSSRTVGALTPVASLLHTREAPWIPLAVALASGLVAATVFARRTAVT